jgi:hypothetical protein
MMSKLSIASWGLVFGAIGQAVFYRCLFPSSPDWVGVKILFGLLLLPWLTVFTISYCNRPPFGPRLFRYCLSAAMCWYAFIIMLAEALNLYIQPAPREHLSMTIARVFMYLGTFSFIVFIRTCILLRRNEKEGTPNQHPPQDCRLP